MSRFSSIVRGQLTKSEEKRAALARASQQKRDDLNPEFAFNIHDIDITDADSIRDRQTGAELRLGGGEGRDFDAYEATPFGYDQNPVKEAIHKQSYADAFGVKLEDVTRDMLLERGQLQKAQFAERLANAADENGNIRYRRRGIDDNNRVIADISQNENTAAFLQQAGDRDEDAGYKGKFNFLRSLEDFQSGDTVEHNFGRGKRSKTDVVTDQLTGFVAGTGDMAIGLAQTGAVLLGQGQRSAEFFEGAREGTQNFREATQSDQKLRGDRLASKRSEQRKAISSMRKAQYMSDGDGSIEAGIKAGISEYADTAQDFWNNPGRALDAFSESLPYMLGVGAAGSSAARIATNKLRAETFKDLAAFSRAAGSRKGGKLIGPNAKGSTIAETREATEKFLHSAAGQNIIRKTVDRVGVGTVGLTEGMTNAADVFSEVMKMSEEEAFQSEAYSELRARGMSHKDALYELAQGAWAQSLATTTLLAGAAAKLTGAGAFEARMFTGIRNPAKAAAKPAPKPTVAGRHYISKKQAGKELAESQGRKAPTAAQIKKGRKKILDKRAGVKTSRIPGIIKGAGKGTAAVGRLLKEPGKAAGKEFAEESIQSGGGELLGQIAKQKATGEEIGPGVGEATAEGGIVGFLSGGLVSSVTSGFKKGAEKISNRKKGDGAVEAIKTFVDTTSKKDPTTAVGGDSVKAIVQSTKDPKYDPIGSINSELDNAEGDPTGTYGFNNFNAINIHYERAALKLEKDINEATDRGDTKALTELNEQYDKMANRTKGVIQQFGQVMTNTLREAKPRFKDGTATVNDLAMLDKASRLEGFAIDPEILAVVGDSTKAVLAQNKSINDLIGSLDDPKAFDASVEAELKAQGVESDSPAGQKIRRDMMYAHKEKMSNTRYSIKGTDAVDVRGVRRYVNDIADALQRNAPEEVAALTKKLKGFVTGQAAKLVRLKGIKGAKPATYQISLDKDGNPSGKTYTYSEAGIDALIATVEAEQVPMQKLLDLLGDKAVTYAQVQAEGVGLASAKGPEPGAIRAMKNQIKDWSLDKLKARAKALKMSFDENVTQSDLVQAIATFIYNKENAPKGSDTPTEEVEEQQPEAATTDAIELTQEDYTNQAALTTSDETGGHFLQRINSALSATNPAPILLTKRQNVTNPVKDFMVNRGYVRDHVTEAGNTVWAHEPGRTKTEALKITKVPRVRQPPSALDLISRDEDGLNLSDSLVREAFQDSNSSDRTPLGRQLFYANKGLDEETLPIALKSLGVHTGDINSGLEFVASELRAMVDGTPLTYTKAYATQADNFNNQNEFDDQQAQADLELEAALPEQVQPAPVAEPAARQGKPSEGTQETPQTPYEQGQAIATNAYAELLADNSAADANQVNTALGKGGRNLDGLVKEGYNTQAAKIQKNHKTKADGKTTDFNTSFNDVRTRLQDARNRQATATGQEATTVGEEVDALQEEAEQLVNEYTDDVEKRQAKLKTLGQTGPAPLAQLRQPNQTQQALAGVKGTQTALRKGIARFQRKFSGLFPTIAEVQEVIDEGGTIGQYDRAIHKDVQDLWALDAANDAAMATYTNAKLGRTAEQAAEIDQGAKDIAAFRALSPVNRIDLAFSLGLTVTAADASKAGLTALTKKVIDRQAELRAESALKTGSVPQLAQLTQDVNLESNLENLNEEDAPIVGANNVLFALRNDTRDKLTKLITYLKELMGNTVIPSIQHEITVAEGALVQLDSANMNRTEMQLLSSRIHEAVEKRLRSDDFQYLEHQAPSHQQALLALAEMGSDGSLTVAMRESRDKLLRDLLNMIDRDVENGADPIHTDARVLDAVYGFLRANPKSWQNAFLAGGVRLTDYKDDLQHVLEGTAKNSLPTKLADSFKSASKESSSYLTIFPNFASKLARDFSVMEPELDLYPAVATFQTFHDDFRTQLLKSAIKWGPDSKSKQSIFARNGLHIVKSEDNRILQDPMWMLRDSFGNINENLITAMALESFLYTTGAGQRTLYNTPAEINRIVGRPSNEDPLDDEIDVLSTVGDGIEQVYDLLASKIMQHVNIKGTGLTTGQLRTTMPRALAARAVTTLGEMGLITVRPVDLSQFKEDQDVAEDERKFVRLQMDNSENLVVDRFSARIRDLHSKAVALSESGHLEAMFGPIAKAEQPSFEPFENVETKIRKTAMVAPTETSAGTKAHQDRPLTRNTILVEGMQLFPEGEQYLQMAHGYQPDMRNVHKTKVENIRGRNGNFVRDYENSFRWMQSMDKAGIELFYVPNRNITNLRTMEVNVHANTQASKFQRPLFPKHESMGVFSAGMTTTTAYNSKEETGFFRSVAQKLGGKLIVDGRKVKVEYLSDAVMLENVDALIDTWQEYIDVINDPKDTAENGRPIFDAAQVKLFLDSTIAEEENGETYMTLVNLAKLQKPGTDTEFHMFQPVQTDSTTSGFANSLMQLATASNIVRVKEALRRVGVAFKEDPISATAYMQANPDSYEIITQKISDIAGFMTAGLGVRLPKSGTGQFTGEVLAGSPLVNALADAVTELNDLLSQSAALKKEQKNKIAKLSNEVRILSVQTNERLLGFSTNTLGLDIDGNPQGVMPDLVGTDGVTSAGRNFSKPSFMLGNYNAGRRSAKRALASGNYSTMLDMLSQIDNTEELQGAMETILEAKNEMVAILQKVGDPRGKSVKITPNVAELAAAAIEGYEQERQAKYRKETRLYGEASIVNLGTLVDFASVPALPSVLKQIFSDTYGEALHIALDTELDYLMPARDSIHQMAFMANAIFQVLFKERVDRFTAANGVPDVTQMKHIIDKMVNEGLFPAISSAVSTEMNDKIEAVKRETLAFYINNERVRGKLGFEGASNFLTTEDENGQDQRTAQSTLSFTVLSQGFKEDPGVVMAVRAIQAIEAVIQTDLLAKYAMTNTYDGQGTEGALARDVALSANESAVKRNHDYNIFEAANDMLASMMRVMHTSSTQLSGEQKNQVLKAIQKKDGRAGEPRDVVDKILNELAGVQADINRGRDLVWEDALTINNYMESPESELSVAKVLGFEPAAPKIYQTPSASIDSLSEAYDRRIHEQEEHNKAWMIKHLGTRVGEGINAIGEGFKEFIRAEPKKTMGVGYFMDLLVQSLQSTDGNEELTGVVQKLYTYLKTNETNEQSVKSIRGIRIHLSETVLKDANRQEADGLYYPRGKGAKARIELYAGATNFIPTALHEIFHAVVGEYIDKAAESADNTAEFEQMIRQANGIIQSMLKSSDQSKVVIGAILENILAQGDLQAQKNAISEVISNVTSTFIRSKSGRIELKFIEHYTPVLASLTRMIEMATEEPAVVNKHANGSPQQGDQMGLPFIHEGSSAEEVDTVDFLRRHIKQLPGQQVAQVFKEIEALDSAPSSKQHNEILDNVIERWVLPNNQMLNSLTVKIATNPDSIRNIGQVDSITNNAGKVIGETMYLEAAGNQLTSNVDLSLKEVTTHEYLHPIVRWAIKEDWYTHKKLQALFEAARDKIEWHHFMPRAPSGDIVYAQQQARARYEYIFENPNGDLSEFLINGLVNEELISILAEVDAPNTTQAVWEGPTYKTLTNIMGRLMRFFTKAVYKSKTGKVGDELTALMGHITALNMQAMNKGLHRARTGPPLMDTANGWITDQIGRKIADPLRKWRDNYEPSPTKNKLKDFGFVTTTALIDASNEDFQKYLDTFFRQLGVQKDNTLGELSSELMPSQKGLQIYKEMFRKSHHIVDRARRSEIEHMQKLLRAHFDPDRRFKHRRADKAALTHVGMRADLSALLGSSNNFERLQSVMNSPSALDGEIAARTKELEQVTNGDTQLYNLFHNQAMGLAELSMLGQTFRANVQQNPYMIAHQNFFSDDANKRPLQDVEKAEAILDELKTLFSLKLAAEHTPGMMSDMRKIMNHEMSRDVAVNGIQMFMNMHIQFKEQSKKRLFRNNPVQMSSGYVYEQYNPDIDLAFTTETLADIKKMEDKGYKRIGVMPRDPRDPLRTQMIMWKGLNGKAMYMKAIVSPTDISARGHDLVDQQRMQPGMTTSSAASQARYNLQKLKVRMEKDVLAQMDNPDVQGKQARAVPVYNELGNITNYRYMMTQNHKQTLLEANQSYDYLMGRMFGSIVDKEASLEMNSKTAKLLHKEYVEGYKNEQLRFVEVGANSKDPKVREMWRMLPAPMKEELRQLFGGDFMYIRDDVIKLTLGFRKATIGNAKFLGKHAFAARAAERVWFDVIRLLKMKIVLTMPDVVIGNMASNIAYLLGDGIPLDFVAKEIKNGLKGIYAWQKDEEDLFNLEKAMDVRVRTHGSPTKRQIMDRHNLVAKMQKNPIATLAEQGVFTGIADELEPDAWNYRNKVMQWAAEKTDSWVPASVVSGAKEVFMVPGSETFKVALAATQYADFIARHVMFEYDTKVRGREQEQSLQRAIDAFIYYDIPQNVWLQYANDLGVLMFTKYFFRIQQQIYKLYKNSPLSALGVIGFQRAFMTFPYNSNIGDYALLDNFDITARLHLMPLQTMDSANMLEPALYGALAWTWRD